MKTSGQAEMQRFGDVTGIKVTSEFAGVRMNVFVYQVANVLIDTGPERLFGDVKPLLQDAHIDLVALTHVHEDHTGGAAWIQENLQVPLYIHEMSVDECRRPGEYPAYRRFFWGNRPAFTPSPLKDTVETDRSRLKVIPTPGHSPDHVSFFDAEKGVLFSGDLFVTPKPKVMLPEESVQDTVDSLKTLLRLDFQDLFCGHAGRVEDARNLLQRKVDYLENLAGDILQGHQRGMSVDEIDRHLFPRTNPLVPLSDYEWDSRNLIRSVIKDYAN